MYKLLTCVLVLNLSVIGNTVLAESGQGVEADKNCLRENIQGAGVGDIKHSLLSESAFKKMNGDNWVLLKGQSKDELNINEGDQSIFNHLTEDNANQDKLPDARGKFLRMFNNGVSANEGNIEEILLGGYQPDAISQHSHSHSGDSQMWGNGWQRYSVHNLGGIKDISGETRPKNITVNIYVKVRPDCINKTISEKMDKATELIANRIMDFERKTSCQFPKKNTNDKLEIITKTQKFNILYSQFREFEDGKKNWNIDNCLRRVIGGLRYLVNFQIDGDYKLSEEQIESYRKITRNYRFAKTDEYNFEK